MTKCLFKALKAVGLDKHVELFRSLGYESAGALAHFRTEHFERLNLTEQELLHLISLLDVLKEATRDGKICPHYFSSNKQQTNIKSASSVRASWCEETSTKISSKRAKSSTDPLRRSTIPREQVLLEKTSTILSREQIFIPWKTTTQKLTGARSFLNRPAVEHVKVKSYNYGVPTNKRSRPNTHRHYPTETNSYGKPAEIYVYARKRPLLPSETNFEDIIAVPDDKRIIIAENKANLDCTPLLKKTEFQYDHVFGSEVSNKQVFESTVLPFISANHRHNLTYICFGQTGSGKSHTIFGSKNTDGLLIYCTQLLLQEVNVDNRLICSFYEIYNNQVYDLVNVGKRLFVREDGEHHVNIIGITEFLLKSLDNLRCVIDEGLSRRHHGKSAFNSNSSRSHAVFQITLQHNYDASEDFRLIFIDLAGSERATDAQNNLRQTRREGAQINCSLLALKECIRSMDMTHSHAPFRQSKLTHILRDSLVGSKTRTCLMANVSPPNDCCQCSLNTLQYASRIRNISIRHRHRTVTMESVQTSSADETSKEQDIVPEKPQRISSSATTSTPVHRLISSVDSHNYLPRNPTDIDTRKTKPFNIDWQMADDDLPITGGGDNRVIKSLIAPKRELKTTTRQSNRLYEKKTKANDHCPSSYFPMPQSDIKKPSSSKITRVYDSSRLMYDDGNDRNWKAISTSRTHRFSNASIEQQSTSDQNIPTVPMQTFSNHLYSNSTAKESLGAKSAKVSTHDHRYRKSSATNALIDDLNLNKYHDPNDDESLIYSDRQSTYRDQTAFFTKRDELLSIISNRLSSANQRSSSLGTPRKTKPTSQKTASNVSHPTKSKNLFVSSSSKTYQASRPTKTANNGSSRTTNHLKKSSLDNKKPKAISSFDSTLRYSSNQQQRTLPFRVHYSSDSDDNEDKPHVGSDYRKSYPLKTSSYSTHSEGYQIFDDCYPVKNEQEPHSQQMHIPATSSTTLQPSLSSPALASSIPVRSSFEQLLAKPISPVPSTTLSEKPWTLSTSLNSPSKDFALRVSDQLNVLRSLLETHLIEPVQPPKDSADRPASPGTFARDFLKSCRQSTFKTSSSDFLSGDDDDREVASNFDTRLSPPPISPSTQYGYLLKHDYEQIIQPTLSSFSAKLNQVKEHSTENMSSPKATKHETQEPQNQDNRIPSTQFANENQVIPIEITSNPPNNNDHTSQIDSAHSNPPIVRTSLNDFDSNHSSFLVLPPFNTLHKTDRTHSDQEQLLDNDKSTPFLTTSPFNTILSSLKSMHEKDLNFGVHTGDDKLIPVTD
ncbi:unnamed protein product [Adineta ricciae]|uniref:Kinesin motor domain-containing protein n=1 Tax=Adineta ricciae TaxID=249248 RepID=A0A814JB69_ADIRI|nr:unnamed protein product [Adineta ricciae]CAF1034403.1 unnamed protein product [Adineta ricciae]